MKDNGSTAKNKAPAFQFYAGDFLTDVMDWTDEEVGVHIRLLCWSWVNRRGIPRDTQRLTRIAPGVVSAWPVIRSKWSEGPDDSWISDRLERTRNESDSFRASQREKSLLAVEARKSGNGKNKPTGKPNGKPMDIPVGASMGIPVGNPLEDEDEEEYKGIRRKDAPENSTDPVLDQFEALWVTFERHGVKSKALSYFRQLSTVERAEVIAKAPEYVRSTPGGAYRTYLEGWINPANRKWERPVVQPAPKATTATERSQSTIMDRNAPFIPLREAIKQKNAERAERARLQTSDHV